MWKGRMCAHTTSLNKECVASIKEVYSTDLGAPLRLLMIALHPYVVCELDKGESPACGACTLGQQQLSVVGTLACTADLICTAHHIDALYLCINRHSSVVTSRPHVWVSQLVLLHDCMVAHGIASGCIASHLIQRRVKQSPFGDDEAPICCQFARSSAPQILKLCA